MKQMTISLVVSKKIVTMEESRALVKSIVFLLYNIDVQLHEVLIHLENRLKIFGIIFLIHILSKHAIFYPSYVTYMRILNKVINDKKCN